MWCAAVVEDVEDVDEVEMRDELEMSEVLYIDEVDRTAACLLLSVKADGATDCLCRGLVVASHHDDPNPRLSAQVRGTVEGCKRTNGP